MEGRNKHGNLNYLIKSRKYKVDMFFLYFYDLLMLFVILFIDILFLYSVLNNSIQNNKT
jgi:hypothetical protein